MMKTTFSNNKSMPLATIFLLSLMVISFGVLAQSDKKSVRQGNREFKKGEFIDSEISYRSAIETNPESFKANFNLGDALYRQEKWEEASTQFEGIANASVSDADKASVYHNLGNSHFKMQQFDKSVEAYKQALRLNPNDMETKYNLAQAQRMLQQQQNKDDQQDKQQDDNQNGENDQQQNNQDKDKNKDEQQDQDQQDQQQQPENNEQQQQQNQEQISQEDAQRMLQAIQSREKDIQEKVKKEQARQAKVKVEKNW